jgi:hypothetical protein
VQIGNAVYNANYYWRGELDDVRIYSKALSPAEIMSVMNGESLGINYKNPLEDKIKLFPNPFNESLVIKTTHVQNPKVTISNMEGKVIKVVTPKNSGDTEVKTNAFAPGMYIVSISDNGREISKKVIKL